MRSFGLISVVLAAILFLLCLQPADGGGQILIGEVEVDTSDVSVTIYPSNETRVDITGYGMLTQQNGLLNPLETSLRFHLDGGSGWTATISPTSTINDIQINHPYDFTVTVTIPPGTMAGETGQFTVRGVFEDILETYETSAVFTLRTIVIDDGNEPGGSGNETGSQEEGGSSPPVVLIVFILGILILLGAGGFWAYRNIEVIRDPNGDRRILLREKDTGRPLNSTMGEDDPGNDTSSRGSG